MLHKFKYFNIVIFIVAYFLMMVLAIGVNDKIETNLLKTVLPQRVIESTNLMPVVSRSASIVKVVFEDNTKENLEAVKKNFENRIDSSYFEINKPNVDQIISKYMSNPTNFLSNRTRALLKSEKYDEVFEHSMTAMYNSSGSKLVAKEKDPYMLFDDFIISNRRISQGVKKIDGKYYDFLLLSAKNKENLVTDLNNKKIAELIEIQKDLSTSGANIYLSGTPVHSYYNAHKLVSEIVLIFLISIILISLITYYCFRNVKLIIPTVLSLSFGLLTGCVGVKIWFDSLQLYTILFSTVLVGIGFNYSLYYLYAEKVDRKFVKKTLFSLFSTIIPFVLLYFSKIELLEQISVYTVISLVTIYLTVFFLYPMFERHNIIRNIDHNPKLLKNILIILSCVSFIGFLRLHFDDSIAILYSPLPNLKQAEQLYSKVSGDNYDNTQIILVKGKNIEDIIEKEENITNDFNSESIEYVSISKFLPSKARQQDNFKLVKNLYNATLYKFSDILSYQQIRNIKSRNFVPVIFNVDNFPYFKDFMLDSNTSLIFVFSNKNLCIRDSSADIINLKSDIGKYLKKYRVHLLAGFPFVVILIIMLMSFIYGREKAIKAVTPSFWGAIGAIGLAALYGEINLFSVISLYLVIGLSIGYSISRLDNKEAENAIFLSSIITSLSFLMLTIADFKILNSMAYILSFGIIISYLAGYFIISTQEK